MAVVCPSCNKDFKSNQGLSKHRRTCRTALATTIGLLGKRKEKLERNEAIKIARKAEKDATRERNALDFEMGDIQVDLHNNMDLGQPTPGPSNSSDMPLEPQLDSTSSGRHRKFPRHFRDFLPALSVRLPHMPAPPPRRAPVKISRTSNTAPLEPLPSPSPLPDEDNPPFFETEPDEFGLFRSYVSRPTYIPDEELPLDAICDASGLAVPKSDNSRWHSVFGPLTNSTGSFFAPFLNATVFRLMSWFYGGSNMKSVAELDSLVKDVLLAEDFDTADLKGFSAAKELNRLDKHGEGPEFSTKDGWIEGSVKILLPGEKIRHKSESDAPTIEVKGLFYRPLTEVIKSAFREAAAQSFHLTPFRLFWQHSEGEPPERVISEMYNSDAVIQEHEKIQSQPREPGCTLETVVASIMLWSDSTHLANFGTAALWPIYAFFGNQSKYTRDLYRSIFNFSATASTLTHLKRELIHAIWNLLLDSDFMHAYEHGIVIRFADGILRRVFPRFFTYSADYPEKILLASIKYLAQCPCPRCLIKKDQIGALGTKLDSQRRNHTREDDMTRQDKIEMTRGWIFEKGYGVLSAAVERVLSPMSLVPTRNAFSAGFSKFGFNFYSMFVVDLLHEFELGVWKAVFTHLMRVLYASGNESIQKLNERYRKVPTFGRDTIRRFCRNASGMKKLAARDFEDLLQCAIPVFEGLLPSPHNEIVLDLLFTLATWHAYAKLRLHTESTLALFEAATTSLGQALRLFARVTCGAFNTRELPREEAARGRRKAAAAAKKGKGKAAQSTTKKTSPKRRLFNLCTYKLHALGDYVKTIWLFGTTDNYSTQVGELEHRRVKRFYSRTNKFGFTRQISKHERRERILHNIRNRNQKGKTTPRQRVPPDQSNRIPPTHMNHAEYRPTATVSFQESDPLPYTPPTAHHHISDSTRHYENIAAWLATNNGDPALQDFLPRLKDHILTRILNRPFDGDQANFSDEDRSTIIFVNNRLYKHKVLRVNYTTYDLRRCQDSMNPRTHADIMVLSHEDEEDESKRHPYWYARVIGIFHANVQHVGPNSRSSEPQKMEFLWVRWFGRDLSHRAGWKARRLHRLGFDEQDPFGFLDPNEVIRGVHLIPAFAHGHTSEKLAPSIARQPSENDEDWTYYYIDMFVDRDMVMRFCGGGIGHKSSSNATANPPPGPPDNASADAEMGGNDADAGEGGGGGGGETHGDKDMDANTPGSDDSDKELEDEDPESGEERDYGYADEDEEESGDGEPDSNDEDGDGLGPEDGEDDWEDDTLGLEGYAAL